MSESFENLKDFIISNLPHGSGINYDWVFENKSSLYNESDELIGIEFVFSNKFDTMTEYGMYCHVIPFSIKVICKFSDDGDIKFSTEFEKFTDNCECENCGGTDYSLEEYLEQVFLWCEFSLGIEE